MLQGTLKWHVMFVKNFFCWLSPEITTRRMVRSAHLALSPINLPFLTDIRTRKCIRHRWYGEMSWSQHSSPHASNHRINARAWCGGDLCWDEPISPSQRCRIHITLPIFYFLFYGCVICVPGVCYGSISSGERNITRKATMGIPPVRYQRWRYYNKGKVSLW